MRSVKPVLLVEDDEIHAMTVKRALKELKVTNQISQAANGEEALKYLQDQSNKKPCVILLDLNMPRMNGIEFLKLLKADELLQKIPVIVLTTSGDERDVADSFRLGVAGYIIKPFSYQVFVEKIKIVDLYWTLSELPNGE